MDERTLTELKHELIGDTVRASPLAAYAVSLASGVDWPSIAAMLAALYTLILILEKAWKWWVHPWLRRRRNHVPGRYPQDE